MKFDTFAALCVVLAACWTLLRHLRAPSGCGPCQPDQASPGEANPRRVDVNSLGLSKHHRG